MDAGNILNTLSSGNIDCISSAALSFVESSISISCGWYVLYASGVILVIYGLISAVLYKKIKS